MSEQKVHALTNSNNRIINVIITPVEITNVLTSQTLSTNGIWDTGATDSVVTKSTAAALELLPVGRTIVRGIHGNKSVNIYYLEITLNNKNIKVEAKVTECDELSADNSVGMLIGMDIINIGDFAITNYQEKTTMSFRVPSMQKIDFVTGMKSETFL
jgi:hypothetical protein